MINVGIMGGAGYTAGELIRILLWHPQVQLKAIHSTSHLNQAITQVHKDLSGETNLKFSEIDFQTIDTLFLCSGHGKSKDFLSKHKIPASVKIIDLSADYRIKSSKHSFIYGLPELNADQIKESNYIANPGCFATAIQLGLLPLAYHGLLTSEIHANAITGSTGAGQAATATTHFSWKNNNVAVYKPFTHQHLVEIKQSLTELQSNFNSEINFIPVRGNFSRGILATLYTQCSWSEEKAKQFYADYYESDRFVTLVDDIPDLKQVVNTNKCFLYLAKFGDKLMIISIIDNLLKGASGQAVQNMNLMFNLPEYMGLKLKPVGF